MFRTSLPTSVNQLLLMMGTTHGSHIFNILCCRGKVEIAISSHHHKSLVTSHTTHSETAAAKTLNRKCWITTADRMTSCHVTLHKLRRQSASRPVGQSPCRRRPTPLPVLQQFHFKVWNFFLNSNGLFLAIILTFLWNRRTV